MINPSNFTVEEARQIKDLRETFFDFLGLATYAGTAMAEEVKTEMKRRGVPTISEANFLINYYGV